VTATWRRVFRDYRVSTGLLAAGVLLNAGAYMLGVRPLAARSAGAEDRAARAATSRRAAEREQALAESLVNSKARADKELDEFYQKLLPTDLVSARRLTYASLPALARRSNVEYEERTYQEASKKGESLGRLEIRMVLEGDYEGLREFIHELERAPEFVIIDELMLTELAEGDRLKLSLGLSTYFQQRGNGD
jgi:hypothetical protein